MRKWTPLVAVALGTLMLLIDVTIINVAIPHMGRSLGADLADLQWVVNAYALALGAVLLGAGGLADRVGHAKIYVCGLVVFALASLVCGIASDLSILVAARAVQGIGGAAMLATGIALLSSSYSGKDRGIAFGVWGAVAGAAGGIGPVLGGFLTEEISWRWVFIINIPVSVIAIVLSYRVFRINGTGDRSRRLDYPGTILFTVAAAAATFGLIEAGAKGWSSAEFVLSAGIAVLALAVFVVVELVVADPVFDLRLLRNGSFTGILVGSALLNFAAFSYLLYSGLWLQTDRGMSPVAAGLAGAAPLAIAGFVVSGAIGRHLHDSNPRWIIGGGLLLISIGAALQGILNADSSWTRLIAGLVVAGCGVGLATPTLVSAAMSSVPPTRGGMAAGAVNTARQLGLVFGIALLGTVFQARVSREFADAGIADANTAARAVAGGGGNELIGAVQSGARAEFASVVHSAFAAGLNITFYTAALVGIVGALVSIALIRASEHNENVNPANESETEDAHTSARA
ncbi:EmrB/QacA subfamily drug resistance transporter [Rhodococcus sp. 27YEA15]|uniref:MFS transporter n=1 Tax=Rhodococcus sp. 27YEA15 TaxID=3156259 RepID=UPI003C7E8801